MSQVIQFIGGVWNGYEAIVKEPAPEIGIGYIDSNDPAALEHYHRTGEAPPGIEIKVDVYRPIGDTLNYVFICTEPYGVNRT